MRGWVVRFMSVAAGTVFGVLAVGASGADAATTYQVIGSGLVGTPDDFLLYNVNVAWSEPDFIAGDTTVPQASLQCSNTGGFLCDSAVTISSKSGLEDLTFTIFNPTFGNVTIDSLFALSAFMRDGVTVGSDVQGPVATLTVTGSPDVAPTPVPAAWTLMLIGLVGLGVVGRKRNQVL